MKKIVILALGFLLLTPILSAQGRRNIEQMRWTSIPNRMPPEWFSTEEAAKIAEQVLFFQREAGGWPKNIPMHRPIEEDVRKAVNRNAPGYEPTLDNDATFSEMIFMAKMFQATGDNRYRESFERGLNYILEAQYDNGGWPQFYPLKPGYYTRNTYNDDAIYNAMVQLRAIFNEEPLYAFAATPQMKERTKKAFDKGVECILKTQIYVNGEPTVWCAQHDEVTFQPAKARAYELPSFSGNESAFVALLLMEIPDPSPEVIKAVEGAVKWFESHKIRGIRVKSEQTPEGVRDRIVVEDPEAPAIWARFYDLDTQQPFFVGRDGVKREKLADIEYERRNGYGYYSYNPQKVLEKYPDWKAGLKK